MKGECHSVPFDERSSTAAVQCTRVPRTNHGTTGHNVDRSRHCVTQAFHREAANAMDHGSGMAALRKNMY
jgi:hypothetical protein